MINVYFIEFAVRKVCVTHINKLKKKTPALVVLIKLFLTQF